MPELQRRSFTLELELRGGDEIEASLSSTAPVERGGYLEVLDHAPGAIDMSRAAGGLPLLMDHDGSRLVGRVENIRSDGQKLRGRLRFGASALAQETRSDVLAGIRRDVSVGYRIAETRREGERRLVVTRWAPHEASLVGVPLDPTVGVGRSLSMEPHMPDDLNPAAAIEAERRRIAAILELGKRHDLADAAQRAIAAGTSEADFARAVLDDLAARQARSITTTATTSGQRIEVRVAGQIGEIDTATFRGELWRAADGSLVPVLAHGQSLAAILPRPANGAAVELGLGGLVRALVLGPRSDIERRALGEASQSTGGAMVPTPLAAEVIDRLRAVLVTSRAGVRFVPMGAQTLKIARITSDPVAAWRAENAAVSESDPAFDSVTLTAKSLSVYFRTSRELLEDVPNMDATIRNVLAQAFALALDAATLVGTGSSNQPLGINGISGLQSVSMGTNGGQFTSWAKVLDAVQSLEDANAGTVSAMILAPRTARTINGLADTTNQPLMPPPRLANVPILATTAVPVTQTQGTANNASPIFLGDFAEVLVGMRSEFQIQVLSEAFATNGQIGFVGHLRADVAAARPAALAKVIGIIP